MDDLHDLADRSSRLPSSPPDVGLGEVSMSVRAAIRGVDLFPASAAAARPAPESNDGPREREPTSSRPRPITLDRVLLAVAVGGSLVMGYKVGEERSARSGRSSLSAPELAGKVMPGATERAHRVATSFRLEATPPRVEEPVKALPDAKPVAMPAPSWQSHMPRANRSAAPAAKAPAPAPAPDAPAPVAEAEEEPTPSVPPPAMSLVEAMAEAVKAKP